MDDFRGQEWTTLWFPGCGFSPLPRVFSSCGFTAYATDIAPSAIEYQRHNQSIVEPLLAAVTVENTCEKTGSLVAEIHDFRTSFGDENVDAIFNIKSIQGLPATSMSSACRSHFAALRPGGVAVFDTMNVQGERRDQLEDALANAGFCVPLRVLNKCYRQALADTGIPHLLVLDAPMIPKRDDYPYPHKRGSPKYNRDIKILRDITADYRSRMQPEYENEQQNVDETRKHALVIYSLFE